MNGEAWTFIGVAVTALLGGSGVAGLAASGIDLSRRNRLRRRAVKAVELRNLLSPGTPERAALDYAIAVDSVRSSAISAIGLRDPFRRQVRLLPLVGMLYLAMLAIVLSFLPVSVPEIFRATIGVRPALITALAGALVGLLAVALTAGPANTANRRKKWERAVLRGSDPAQQADELK